MATPLRVHAALIAVSVLFGGSYVFSRRILAEVPPSTWVLLRVATAMLLIVPLARWLRPAGPWPGTRALAWLTLASLLGVAANQVLFVEGLARTTPEHSAIVNALIPTWTLLFAVLSRQERLTRLRVLAIASSLLGVGWLGVDQLLAKGDADGDATLLGDLLTIGNGMAFALHLVVLRRFGRGVDPWSATAVMFVTGTAMLLPWSLPDLTTDRLAAACTWPTLGYATYVILGATVLTYVLNTWALRSVQSSQVALYINLQPLVAATLNWSLGAPAPGSAFFVALGLVGTGLWLQTRAAAVRSS